MIKLNHTKVEEYQYKKFKYYVKREDLCCPKPGPPFSKVRGVLKVLQKYQNKGYSIIGYTETSISMAGWCIAWMCNELGMQAVIYNPIYKNHTPKLLKYHRRKWEQFNAHIIPIKAGMAKVNYYICKKDMEKRYGKTHSIMLPLGLPFKETIKETLKEVKWTINNYDIDFKSVIVNVGSGTIASGVAKGFKDKKIYGIMGRTGNISKKRNLICKKGDFCINGFMRIDFNLIDPGWEYTDKSNIKVPFPCHPYYDAKAYEWMIKNIKNLEHPRLFWNIGSI